MKLSLQKTAAILALANALGSSGFEPRGGRTAEDVARDRGTRRTQERLIAKAEKKRQRKARNTASLPKSSIDE